jgi:WhiB family redox-sensing transcriptional regulator
MTAPIGPVLVQTRSPQPRWGGRPGNRPPMPTYPGTGWMASGACRDEDPELFFPVGTDGPAVLQAKQAAAVCLRCQVSDACLRWAIRSGQGHGVWGGATEEERREISLQGAAR